jgi:signal peptidase
VEIAIDGYEPKTTSMLRRVGWRRVLGWGATIAVVGVWFVLFRPMFMGGPASYVTVEGVSMGPTYHTGDLIVTHRESNYHSGEVIAYHVPAGQPGAGDLLIHRIVGGNGTTGFTTKGDANPYADQWQPKTANVVGTPFLLIPKGGRLLFLLRAPFVIAGLAALLAVWIVLGDRKKNQQRR